MYLNIFDVFQGATMRELFATVTIPSPTTKISTMVRTLLINILCTVLTVKFYQPSHKFTFSVDMSFILYPLVLTPLI
jgi:hypothetical protein